MDLTADIDALTPCEEINGRWYKRDDLLAFDNGVNGKVRTSVWLAERAGMLGAVGLVYGGSVHAPALGRVASAAAYVGLDCTLVIGSDPVKAVRHDTVRVAVQAGAELVKASVAYNPELQRHAARIAAGSGGERVQVPYGVSTPADWSPKQVMEFLEQDAPQVDNLPDELETLVVPFGSGNAASGVLYGLSVGGAPYHLKRVVLVGVGPDKWPWLMHRLESVGVDLSALPFKIKLMPLHPHFAEYKDRMSEHQDGIDFHPTYEGKVVRFLDTVRPSWWTERDGTTGLWIVGGPLP